MKDFQTHLMTNRLDGVFYAIDAKANTILNLLEQWSKIILIDVSKWIKAKAWDFYNLDNLQMSSKFSMTQFQMNSMKESRSVFREMRLDCWSTLPLFKTCNRLGQWLFNSLLMKFANCTSMTFQERMSKHWQTHCLNTAPGWKVLKQIHLIYLEWLQLALYRIQHCPSILKSTPSVGRLKKTKLHGLKSWL